MRAGWLRLPPSLTSLALSVGTCVDRLAVMAPLAAALRPLAQLRDLMVCADAAPAQALPLMRAIAELTGLTALAIERHEAQWCTIEYSANAAWHAALAQALPRLRLLQHFAARNCAAWTRTLAGSWDHPLQCLTQLTELRSITLRWVLGEGLSAERTVTPERFVAALCLALPRLTTLYVCDNSAWPLRTAMALHGPTEWCPPWMTARCVDVLQEYGVALKEAP